MKKILLKKNVYNEKKKIKTKRRFFYVTVSLSNETDE